MYAYSTIENLMIMFFSFKIAEHYVFGRSGNFSRFWKRASFRHKGATALSTDPIWKLFKARANWSFKIVFSHVLISVHGVLL